MVFHHRRQQNKYRSKTVSHNDDIQNVRHAKTEIFDKSKLNSDNFYNFDFLSPNCHFWGKMIVTMTKQW